MRREEQPSSPRDSGAAAALAEARPPPGLEPTEYQPPADGMLGRAGRRVRRAALQKQPRKRLHFQTFTDRARSQPGQRHWVSSARRCPPPSCTEAPHCGLCLTFAEFGGIL